MFELICKWVPKNTTIKSTLLNDIKQIQHEIMTLNCKEQTKQSTRRCKNGDSCWYLRNGRCWFEHDCNTTAIGNIPSTQQSRVNENIPNTNDHHTTDANSVISPPTEKQRSKSNKQKKNRHKTKHPKEVDERKRKTKRSKRRRRKKKKQNINSLFGNYGNNKVTGFTSHQQSPETSRSAGTNEVDNICLEIREISEIDTTAETAQSLMPSKYTFDTIDTIGVVIDEEELLNKIDYLSDDNEKIFALLQVRNIVQSAVDSEWTFEEAMKQVDCALTGL